MTGGPDPQSRGAFPWDSIDHHHPVRETVRELTALRRRHSALRTGTWRALGSQHDAVAYWRRDGAGSLLVVINRGRDGATFETGHTTQLLWGNGLVEESTVTVPARDAAIFH